MRMFGISSPMCMTVLLWLVVLSTCRKMPRQHASPAISGSYQYQIAEKPEPTISLNDKENIYVKDDDDEKFNVSVEKSYKDDKALEELSRYRKVKVKGRENEVIAGDSNMDLMSMMVQLTERVASLQHTLTNIKLQNHYIYRTIKKGYKQCQSTSSDHLIQTAAQKMEKLKCPSGYMENSDTNTCYKFAVERITWRMARERCRVEDSDLVSIETKTEQRWITQQARQSPDSRHCDFWTGATDKNLEGDWRWITNDNALSFSNWNHNEPNNGRGDEHCMQMLWVFNWAWNDARCNYNNACYICEVALEKVGIPTRG